MHWLSTRANIPFVLHEQCRHIIEILLRRLIENCLQPVQSITVEHVISEVCYKLNNNC